MTAGPRPSGEGEGNGVFVFVETSMSDLGLEPLAAARAMGMRPVLVTANPAWYKGLDRCAVEVRDADTTDAAAVVRTLADVRTRLCGVLSLTDYSIHVAAQVAHELNLPGLSPDAARTARDKLATREACARAGVPVPDLALVRSAEEAAGAAERLGLPCVVKPLTEAGSVEVALCRTVQETVREYEAIAAIRTDHRGRPRPPGALVEEYLLGYEVSVETVTRQGAHLVVGVTDKLLGPHPHFVEVGDGFPSVLPEATTRACVAAATAALEAVGHDFGASHVEIKVTPDGPRLVEVNARMAGGKIARLIRETTGLDLPPLLVRLHAGLPTEIAVRPRGGAASRYLVSASTGTLRAVHGTELVRRIPGLVDFVVAAEPGNAVRRAESNIDYLGHLITVGSSTGEAGRLADAALGQLTFDVEPA